MLNLIRELEAEHGDWADKQLAREILENREKSWLDEDERESSIHEMRNEGCGAFENLN